MSNEAMGVDDSQNTSSGATAPVQAPAEKLKGGFTLAANPTNKQIADNEGEWVHLVHPRHRHPLYVGEGVGEDGAHNGAANAKPMRVKVLHLGNPRIKRASLKLEKEAVAMSRNKELTPEQHEAIGRATIKMCILEFENVWYDNDRELDASLEADKDTFMATLDEFVGQLADFIAERENFLPGASQD